MNKHLLKNKRHNFIKKISVIKKPIKSQKDFVREQIEKELKKEEKINEIEKKSNLEKKKLNIRDIINKMEDIDLSSDED